jgi:hypothetical protein
MKRPGASTAATGSVVAGSVASGVASGVASSVISGAADSVATGAAVSESDAGREITTIARSAIPIIAAIKTRGEVPCFGAALGLAGAGFAGAGVVETFTREEPLEPPSGTGGITILLVEVDFLAADFFFAGAFLATFLATFLAAVFFFAGAFLAIFLAAVFFFAGDFLAAVFFFAGAFLTTFFLATFLVAAFFFTATVKLLQD